MGAAPPQPRSNMIMDGIRIRSLTRLVGTAAVVVNLIACGDRAPEETAGDAAETTQPAAPAASLDEVTQEYDASLGVDLAQMTRSQSGLYVQDLQEGTGDPVVAGDAVSAHYTGWLPDGTKFDSSLDRNDPIEVANVGRAQLIAGWNEGLIGMKRGGRRRLVIPPALGYGAAGRPPVIPPAATLVFDIEILDIR